jgi:putative transposase
MARQTLTLKLPFLRLNAAKAAELARLQDLNTEVANSILALSPKERAALTTADFGDVEIGSAWMNQTIRNARARTKVKRFRVMPLETNNQNWTLYKVGDIYSVGFNLLRGVNKRVPLEVYGVPSQDVLDALLEGRAKRGSLKLWRSRRGIWYALLSVAMEVPDTEHARGWVGVDRGQRHLAVATTPEGTLLFLTFRVVRQARRHYAAKRRRLQKAGKHRTLKRLERKETRFVRHVNHRISKEVVRFAQDHGCGIRLEDLAGIRQRTRQRTDTKRDAGHNRDYWPYFDLETKICYKAALAGVPVETVPAAYTSKSCCRCGAIGIRERQAFRCPRCGYRGHADHNASRNVGRWVGASCPLVLEQGGAVMASSVPGGAVDGSPQARYATGSGRSTGQERESHAL